MSQRDKSIDAEPLAPKGSRVPLASTGSSTDAHAPSGADLQASHSKLILP